MWLDFIWYLGKLSKPVTTAVMSYQPAKSFRNRIKHAFDRLSIDVNQFSAPDMVHFCVIKCSLEWNGDDHFKYCSTNFYSRFYTFSDGGQPRVFVQSRNQRIATYLCNIGPRFLTGDCIMINKSQKKS